MIRATFCVSTLLIKVGLPDVFEGISDRLLRGEFERLRGSANNDLDVYSCLHQIVIR